MYEVELPRAPPAALLGGEASSWGEHCDATNLQQVSTCLLSYLPTYLPTYLGSSATRPTCNR